MNTRKSFYFMMVGILLTCSAAAFAQNAPKSIKEQFTWKDASKSQTLYIDLEKKSKNMMLNLDGVIKKGSLEVTLVNPKGETIPGFLLVCDETEGHNVSMNISVGEDDETNQSASASSTTSRSSSSASARSAQKARSAETARAAGTARSASKARTENSMSISSSAKTSTYSQSSTHSANGAKGVMSKIISDPEPGIWKITIALKDVTGTLNVDVDQDE